LDDQAIATQAAQAVPLVLPEPPRTADDTDEIPLMVVHPHLPADDVMVAQWTAPQTSEPSVAPTTVDIPLANTWATHVAEDDSPAGIAQTEVAVVKSFEPDREVERTAVAPTAPAPIDVIVTRPPSPVQELPWAAVRRYEAAAVGALAEVLRAIDDRVAGREPPALSEAPPSSFDQARALTELNEMLAEGAIDAETARGRRDRLIILGDVCVRLRTVAELHAGGHLSADELEAKRASLSRSLSEVLMPHSL
jgi:hypothetical protein